MNIIKRIILLDVSLVTLFGLSLVSSTAFALASNSSNSGTSNSSSANLLQLIITKGNSEISRRLTSLNSVSSQISGISKLTASDKSYLTNEVNTEITGLTSLKTQLDAATTAQLAVSLAQSIISEYRVYALVLPKVWLIKTADTQQVTESKLSLLAQKIQTRITSDQNSDKNVSSLQTELNAMITQTNNAQAISNKIETTVLHLQPSSYDSDHTILSGDRAQLITAHSDNEAAYTDAISLVSSLTSL